MEANPNEKTTQTEHVLEYLREEGSITTLEAFTELGITRLPARIYELRNADPGEPGHGLTITKDMKEVRLKNDARTRCAEYTIEGREEVADG